MLCEFESSSPFLPTFQVPLLKTQFGEENTKLLRDMVLAKENYILETTKPYPSTDDYDWLTNRLYDYNLLDYSDEHPVLNDFKKFIYDSYVEFCHSINAPIEKIYIQMWANIIRNNGRRITPHHHIDAHIGAPQEYSYVSGNICVDAVETNTYYRSPFLDKKAFPIKNVAGDMIMFPSWAVHWTDKNESDVPRISIAYDIVTEHVYNLPESKNQNFRFLG